MAQRLRYKIGEHEIEVEGSEKFIKQQLKDFFARAGASRGGQAPQPELPEKIAEAARKGKAPSPAEFFRAKKPRSGTEQLIVLAKYLEDFRSIPEFKPAIINKLASEAKLNDLHPQYYSTAVKQGLLRTMGKGKYSLTLSGEDAVLSMPASKTKSG